MKTCPICGTQVQDDVVLCTRCGAAFPVPAADPYLHAADVQQPNMPPFGRPDAQGEQIRSFDEFYNLYASNGTKGAFTGLGVIAAITAVVSLVLIFLMNNLLGILDVVFYTTLAILLLAIKKRNFELPLIMVIYSTIWSIVALATGGTPGGVIVLILGISTCVKMKKLKDAWKLYGTTGNVPIQPI